MSSDFNAILEAALRLLESERFLLVDRLMDTLHDDGVTLSIDDPRLHEELERRLNDGSELIPCTEVRDGRSLLQPRPSFRRPTSARNLPALPPCRCGLKTTP